MRTQKSVKESKNYKPWSNPKPDGYFENLPKGTQELVKELILEAAADRGGPEGYRLDSECIEEVECHSRDGFTAFDHNRGGWMYRNFTDLMGYFGGGYTPAHIGAANDIQGQIDHSFELVAETMAELMGKDFEYYFGSDLKRITYGNISDLRHSLEESGQKESAAKVSIWESKIQDLEYEYLAGSESTIMHELRFMYHGKENGKHSASVSAALNTEGPYHRSSISWAKGVFCEGAKEVEITWTNQTELKRKLKAALAKCSKAVF